MFVASIENYLLQSERCSVSSLFSAKESVIEIRWGVVTKTARVHWKIKEFIIKKKRERILSLKIQCF